MTPVERGWLLRTGTVYSYWRDDDTGRQGAWTLAEHWLEMPYRLTGECVTIAPACIVEDA